MPDSLEREALRISEQALDQPSDNQTAWILEACGDNRLLLQRVRVLLARVESTEMGLSDDNALLNVNALSALLPPEPPPETLGAYRLLELIGAGGMGSVYKGERSDGAFDRTVAIKLVGAVRSRSDAEVRFTTERKILARMQHPNIAQLLDGGTEGDRGYLVMEYISGQPFDFDSTRDETTTLAVFRKVCAAVQYAHNNLVLHRDIKPDNVLLDATGEPKLLDFGIAKLNQEFVDSDSGDITGATAIPLTLNYSAPERLLGEPATVSSDVYSLGVYLFVLMNGIRPYDLTGKTLPEAWKLLKERTHQESAGTSGDLGLVAMKAMHRDPGQRYSSAAELADDIARYQQGHTVTARAPDWRYSMTMFVSRNRLAVTASALAFLALIGAFVMTGFAYIESEQQKQIAAQEANTASQAVDFLTNVLGSANPFATGQKNTTVEDVLALAKKNLDAGSIDSPAAQAYVETSLAMAHDGRGEYQQALAYAEAAAKRLRSSGATGTPVANTLFVLGLTQVHNDKSAAAKTTFEEALTQNTLDTNSGLWLRVEIETALANTYDNLADEDTALELYQQALAHAEVLVSTGDVPSAEPLVVLESNMGQLLHRRGENDAAIQHYTNSLELTGNQDSYNLGRAITYSNIAAVHNDKKEWPQAIERLEQAIAIHEQANNLSSPDAIITRTGLANIQRRAGNLIDATITINAAHKTTQNTLGEDHFITAYVQNVAATVYCESGNWQQGLDYAKRSLATRKTILPAAHWSLHSAQSVLGACETAAGNFSVAETLLNAAYKKLVELRGIDGTQTLITRKRLDALAKARAAPAPTP